MDYLLGMYFNNHDLFISVSVKVMRGVIYVSFLHLLALCSCLTCEAIFAALRLPGLAPRDCSTVVIST